MREVGRFESCESPSSVTISSKRLGSLWCLWLSAALSCPRRNRVHSPLTKHSPTRQPHRTLRSTASSHDDRTADEQILCTLIWIPGLAIYPGKRGPCETRSWTELVDPASWTQHRTQHCGPPGPNSWTGLVFLGNPYFESWDLLDPSLLPFAFHSS